MGDNDEIEQLKRELQTLQANVISASDHARLLFASDYPMETSADLWQWRRDVIKHITDATEFDDENRAVCPLCHANTTAGWRQRGSGWTPIGLERHFLGEGRSAACYVMQAAFQYHQETKRKKFLAAERRPKLTALAQVQQFCEAAGCICEIADTDDERFEPSLQAKNYRHHHSVIVSIGNERYEIKFGRYFHSEAESCTAEQAAAALIWEDRHPGKRWRQNRNEPPQLLERSATASVPNES